MYNAAAASGDPAGLGFAWDYFWKLTERTERIVQNILANVRADPTGVNIRKIYGVAASPHMLQYCVNVFESELDEAAIIHQKQRSTAQARLIDVMPSEEVRQRHTFNVLKRTLENLEMYDRECISLTDDDKEMLVTATAAMRMLRERWPDVVVLEEWCWDNALNSEEYRYFVMLYHQVGM